MDAEQLEALNLGEVGQSAGKTRKKQSVKMDLDNIAMLARLNIPSGDREALERDMRDIIDMAGRLSEIETDKENGQYFGSEKRDEAGRAGDKDWDRAALIQNAPTKTEEIYKLLLKYWNKGGKYYAGDNCFNGKRIVRGYAERRNLP